MRQNCLSPSNVHILAMIRGWHVLLFKIRGQRSRSHIANYNVISLIIIDLPVGCILQHLSALVSASKLKEKGRDLTPSYDKSPYTNKNVKRATWQHKDVTKKFDYTAIVDRLRTVKWSNYSHPTGVVYRFYRAHLLTQRNSCVIESTDFLKSECPITRRLRYRLRTVNQMVTDKIHSIGAVNRFTDPTFPLPATAVYSTGHILK